jgi:hypothetical protein
MVGATGCNEAENDVFFGVVAEVRRPHFFWVLKVSKLQKQMGSPGKSTPEVPPCQSGLLLPVGVAVVRPGLGVPDLGHPFFGVLKVLKCGNKMGSPGKSTPEVPLVYLACYFPLEFTVVPPRSGWQRRGGMGAAR